LEHFFSIKELESLSGIKAHTIRIWEKRYGLLEPTRTNTNIRQYSNNELRKLMNVATLVNAGHKISKLAERTSEEINNLTEISLQSSNPKGAVLVHIEVLVQAMLQMDEQLFDKTFSNCVLKYGLKDTFVSIIYPFLERIGIMWCSQKIVPANEHFITGLVKQKLFSAIDGQYVETSNNQHTWVLALPEGEYHEIGLLLAHFLLREAGEKSIYLGQNVPFNNIKPSVGTCSACHILTFLIKKSDVNAVKTFLKNLESNFPDQRVLVATGYDNIQPEDYPGINFLHQIDQLHHYFLKTAL
jgi:DNA-binding transcriptional MerR regulator